MEPSFYNGKKILILGMAREGIDSLRFFLKNCPADKIGVADRMDPEKLDPEVSRLLKENPAISGHFGDSHLEAIDSYDIVVKAPGIPIHIKKIEEAFARGKITSQTEIFFDRCPGMIIGITGTKGKSTTASIIYEILKRAGKKVSLVGNIGTPMLQFLERADQDSIFVCELSAHQLYNLNKSPHISILLNIYREHLDYYNDFSEYIRAKANIALHQSQDDFLIYDSSNGEVAGIAKNCVSQKIPFNEYGWTFSGKTALIGKFNLENAKAGAIIASIMGISNNVVDAAISEFKPLENRLEFVGNFNGVDCYNDSLSTIQESAVAAIEGLGPRVQTLIAGGFERNQPFDKLAQAILSSNITTLILFPTTGERIWNEVGRQAAISGKMVRLDQLKHYFIDSMEQAVDLALSGTHRGNICLLSAASASFNNFRDYAHRGDVFKECLKIKTSKGNE